MILVEVLNDVLNKNTEATICTGVYEGILECRGVIVKCGHKYYTLYFLIYKITQYAEAVIGKYCFFGICCQYLQHSVRKEIIFV